MSMKTSPGYTYILSFSILSVPAALSTVLAVFSEQKTQIVCLDRIEYEGEKSDTTAYAVTLETASEEHMESVLSALQLVQGVEIIEVIDGTFDLHREGKITVESKISILDSAALSMAYTPGVARVCETIHQHPQKAYDYTIKGNTVAIVTDGSAVLGLGNIGPLAALPVMEGKAMLMREFGGINAFPICLDTQDVDTIVETVKQIAPSFGAINLEDIAAPRCFEIEKRLKEELDIPVFHDDQHGTAAVTTAALLNAMKLVKKTPESLKVVINGIGAAGTACTHMLLELGIKNIIGCDRKGAISQTRTDLSPSKAEYLSRTNPHNLSGTLQEVIEGADVFIGLSGPKALSVEDIKRMNHDAIVFAMANPTPEIMPELALPHVAVMATGRSDYPNQINNLLAFPGILCGAMACRATDINAAMCLAAAYAIANVVTESDLSENYIIPSVFNTLVAESVTEAVKKAAIESGVATI
eukprot:TRINITY_DN2144_c0_g1_i2.p1 TRINITY_DN2144_c0_g1~~TRINITY_DN2144_c0_g1_i2.p1  ORF type:complete len:471 (+),score=-54.67 TRINITY_DN2144_c0_g1_i2:32-1444(+)